MWSFWEICPITKYMHKYVLWKLIRLASVSLFLHFILNWVAGISVRVLAFRLLFSCSAASLAWAWQLPWLPCLVVYLLFEGIIFFTIVHSPRWPWSNRHEPSIRKNLRRIHRPLITGAFDQRHSCLHETKWVENCLEKIFSLPEIMNQKIVLFSSRAAKLLTNLALIRTFFFLPPTWRGLRGHPFKVLEGASHRRRRLSAFSVRVVKYWNRLLPSVVTAPSLRYSRKGWIKFGQRSFPVSPATTWGWPRYRIQGIHGSFGCESELVFFFPPTRRGLRGHSYKAFQSESHRRRWGCEMPE